eukprot:gene14956-biopygen9635
MTLSHGQTNALRRFHLRLDVAARKKGFARTTARSALQLQFWRARTRRGDSTQKMRFGAPAACRNWESIGTPAMLQNVESPGDTPATLPATPRRWGLSQHAEETAVALLVVQRVVRARGVRVAPT